MLAEQDEMPKPLAARNDDGDLPPQEAPPPRLVSVAEQPWAQACLWPALSESGFGDNTQDSFSRSFADGLLPARSFDPGNHAGRIRSASPHRPGARDWPERKGLPQCSCLGFVRESRTHRFCPGLVARNAVTYLQEMLPPSVALSTKQLDAPSR